MGKEIVKKCTICKEQIYVERKDEDYFCNDKRNIFKHSDCYIKQQMSKKRNPKTYDECMNDILEFKKIVYVPKKNIRKEVTDFIYSMYGITSLPKHFFIKLDSIYSGTASNLSRPIPPEDLLDMWRQKKSYLEDIAEKKRKQNGEPLPIYVQINYDLAILLGKYDSYLQWKEKTRMSSLESEKVSKAATDKIEYEGVKTLKTTNCEQKTPVSNKVDILSMLDEI